MSGTIARLNSDTYKQVLGIAIAPHNKSFISTMAETLIQASYTEGWEGYTYMNQDMIGFCSIAPFKFKNMKGWKICKLIIDARHAGRGHGRKLLDSILAMIDERCDCNASANAGANAGGGCTCKDNVTVLSVDTLNKVAIGLYESLGFIAEVHTTPSRSTPKYTYMVRPRPRAGQ